MADDTKQFLYAWLGKRGSVPEYSFRIAGNKQRQRFLCELTVNGFQYKGVGSSIAKKDAQTNAAKDFIQFLVRSTQMNAEEVPEYALAYQPPAHIEPAPLQTPGYIPQPQLYSKPVFRAGMDPSQLGEGYRPYGGDRQGFKFMDPEKMADAEDVDVNAGLHGNWTIENAKSRLHMFFQTNRINGDYIYHNVGPAHARSFQCEMTVYVPQLGRQIFARESGSNKLTSSKSCALSIVRQLYHLRVIEPFSGTLKKPKPSECIEAFNVTIDPELVQQVKDVVSGLNLEVNPVSSLNEDGGLVNLVQSNAKDLSLLTKREETNQGTPILSWSPPVPNFNPWTACNIDEGHMAMVSLDQLSEEFLESFKEVQQMNPKIQEMNMKRQELPISAMRTQILEAVMENQIILIKGDTGCGKTTQICQYILDDFIMSNQGAYCNIIVTQPRRMAAISVSERVAEERGEEVGMTVGYSVRFESCLPRPYASILFCTVGVLLRKLEGGLRGISHVIIDEIHERDVNTDFLLIVIRDILSVYPDLRVILMSATIDISLFVNYFNGCPVLEVKGRTFPVQTYFLEDIVENIQFRPSVESSRMAKKRKQEEKELGVTDGNPEEDCNYIQNAGNYSAETANVLKQLCENEINHELICSILNYIKTLDMPGAILIFLPGWQIIFSLMRFLENHPVFGSPKYLLLPLHSQIPREDQHRVFEPAPGRIKIILSTNIAETSITVEEVVFVIDACKVKTKLFCSHSNLTTFVQMWASKSNLLQRRGRAGRVRPGVCFHLCTKARFDALEDNLTAEIHRTPLSEIGLAIKLLKLGGISHFLSKAPEPPPLDSVIEAIAMLYDLNCLDLNGDLTPLGKILARLPLDPRLGKMIILGVIFGVGDPIASISANASNMCEIFQMGPNDKRLLPQQRSFAAHLHSDHFALLNALQQWSKIKERQGEEGEYNFCRERFLSQPSLRMTNDAKNQLLEVLNQAGFPEDQLSPIYISFKEGNPTLDTIASVLCTGFYPNVCYHTEKRKVLTTESKLALIHKASVNCNRFESNFPLPFFIFGEKIRTRAISCKNLTMISPIHLLLFGSKKVEVLDDSEVRLDDWINLKINPELAALIISLRPAVEKLISEATDNPEAFFPLNPNNESLVTLISQLSKLTACRSGSGFETPGTSESNYANSEEYGVPTEGESCGFQNPGYKNELFNTSQTSEEGNERPFNPGFGSPTFGDGGSSNANDEIDSDGPTPSKRGRFESPFRGQVSRMSGAFNESPRYSRGGRGGGWQSNTSSSNFQGAVDRSGGGYSSSPTSSFGRSRGFFRPNSAPVNRFGAPSPSSGGFGGRGGGGGGGGHRFFSTNRGGWNSRPRGMNRGGNGRGRGHRFGQY